jgi:hypothetical protein
MATLAELESSRVATGALRRGNLVAPAATGDQPPNLSPNRQEQLYRLAATGEPVHEVA